MRLASISWNPFRPYFHTPAFRGISLPVLGEHLHTSYVDEDCLDTFDTSDVLHEPENVIAYAGSVGGRNG
jgi:hypothetical protein